MRSTGVITPSSALEVEREMSSIPKPAKGPAEDTDILAAANTSSFASALIVDDEPGMRNFMKRALERHFSLVEVAENANTADALRQHYNFDLLITDIRLPGQSGVEWIQQLRGQGCTSSVIFMTAHADRDSRTSGGRRRFYPQTVSC